MCSRISLLQSKMRNLISFLEEHSNELTGMQKNFINNLKMIVEEQFAVNTFVGHLLVKFWDKDKKVFDYESFKEENNKNVKKVIALALSMGSSLTEEEIIEQHKRDLPPEVEEKLKLYFACFCDIYTS